MVCDGIVEVIVTGYCGGVLWRCVFRKGLDKSMVEKSIMQHHRPNATSRVLAVQITKAGWDSVGHKALFARRLVQPYCGSGWLKKGNAE